MTSYMNTTLKRLIQNIKAKCGKRIKQAGAAIARSRRNPKQKLIDAVHRVIGG
jgi:hypothetical protein